jgi:hypothetical protein
MVSGGANQAASSAAANVSYVVWKLLRSTGIPITFHIWLFLRCSLVLSRELSLPFWLARREGGLDHRDKRPHPPRATDHRDG